MADEIEDDGWPDFLTTLDGRRVARVAYEDEPGHKKADRRPCYDCGVAKGDYHVSPMCGVERCPNCGEQYMSCDCEFVGDEPNSEDEDDEPGAASGP